VDSQFHKLPHKITELICRSSEMLDSQLTNSERIMLIAVNRITFGFSREIYKFHGSYKKSFFDWVHDIGIRQKYRGLDALISRKIVIVFRKDGLEYIKINKEFEKWK